MRAATFLTKLPGLAAAALLAACQTIGDPSSPRVTPVTTPAQAQTPSDQLSAPESAPDIVSDPALDLASTNPALPKPGTQQPPSQVPHVYMSFQLGNDGLTVSAIFAIDVSRNNTPSNDPAIRLSPEDGQCNPQEMRSYTFPPKDAATPVVGDLEQTQGLGVRDLPAFLAVNVTNTMLNRGLAVTRDDTRALNICTRKLWEYLVLAENRSLRSAGQ